MKTLFFILVIIGTITSGCSNADEQQTESANQSTDSNPELADSLVQYMTLKNSLVQSDPAAAAQAAKSLEQSLRDEALASLANAISATEDLDKQREIFVDLSDRLIKDLKAVGVEGKLYVQYCPMAFDNAGASWLSVSDEIENPYFGDQMLHCGTVEEVLK